MRVQMELMSSLLFCALVAHLPQALGERSIKRNRSADVDIKFNNSMLIRQMAMRKKLLLNINGPPLVNMITDLQMVFMDVSCSKCIDCMERAIKAYKGYTHMVKHRPVSAELYEEVLNNRIPMGKRIKRGVTTEKSTTKTKRAKPKKKASKTVTVTKYNIDNNVYALKVKETNNDQQNESSCRVYSIKKAFACDTPEVDAFLTSAKRKANKKNRKGKDRKATTRTAETPQFIAPSFRKRQVDNSQFPESFMPSIEELY